MLALTGCDVFQYGDPNALKSMNHNRSAAVCKVAAPLRRRADRLRPLSITRFPLARITLCAQRSTVVPRWKVTAQVPPQRYTSGWLPPLDGARHRRLSWVQKSNGDVSAALCRAGRRMRCAARTQCRALAWNGAAGSCAIAAGDVTQILLCCCARVTCGERCRGKCRTPARECDDPAHGLP